MNTKIISCLLVFSAYFSACKPRRADSDVNFAKPAGSQNTDIGKPENQPTGPFKYCDAMAEELLVEHNKVRDKYSLQRLRLNDFLCQAAVVQAQYFADKNFNFLEWLLKTKLKTEPQSPHEMNGTPASRVAKTEYQGTETWRENYYYNIKSAKGAVDGWMASFGHKEQIISPKVDEVGFGVRTGTAGTSHWIANFGSAGI